MVELGQIHIALFSDFGGRATTPQLVQATGKSPEEITEALEQHDEESNAPFAVVGERFDEFGCHYWVCTGDATYEDMVFDMERIKGRMNRQRDELEKLVSLSLVQHGKAPAVAVEALRKMPRIP